MGIFSYALLARLQPVADNQHSYRGYPEIHELEAPKLPATNQPPRVTRRWVYSHPCQFLFVMTDKLTLIFIYLKSNFLLDLFFLLLVALPARTQDAAALAAQAAKIQPKVLVRLPTVKAPKPIRAAVDTPPTGISLHILHNAPPQSQILPPPLSLLPPPPTGNPIPPTGTRFLTTTLKPPSALPPGRPGEFPRQSYTDNHSRLFRYHR